MRIGLFVAIAVGAAAVAAFANELTKDFDETAPAAERAAAALPAGATALTRADDGHFYAEALVAADGGTGSNIRFLVDTGASYVALTPGDAARIGLDRDALAFDATVRTANGETRAARITLDRVRIGSVELRDVDALVLGDGLSQSLLGMSYLERLASLESSGDALILRR